MKLRSKIFLSCSMIVLMAITVISFVLYSYTADKVTYIYYDNADNTLKLESNYLEQRIMNIMKRITATRLNYSFENTLTPPFQLFDEDAGERERAGETVIQFFQNKPCCRIIALFCHP